jgi:hypothetical protein
MLTCMNIARTIHVIFYFVLSLCNVAFCADPIVAPTVTDGPYIFVNNDNQLTSISLKNGAIEKTNHLAQQESFIVPTLIPSVQNITISTLREASPASTFPMPAKLLAVSDIEGNLDQLIDFLQFHTVIDAECNWSWGTNHLLFNGDCVDRGDKVTELLWFMRKLQQQAIKSGGNVHVVLGNHEAMIMAGDIRYAHPKYKSTAELLGIPYHELFSEQSVLGAWLRAQNSVVQVGEYLFVHAGYSPELDALQLTPKEINTAIRKTLGPPKWPDRTDLATSLTWHAKGPLWYRGYFDKHGEKYGPKPTSEELDAVLARHHAKAIVVGHTVTGTIGWLDGDKRLIGIDVRWDTKGEGQGLLLSNEKLFRLTMTETDATVETVSTANE